MGRPIYLRKGNPECGARGLLKIADRESQVLVLPAGFVSALQASLDILNYINYPGSNRPEHQASSLPHNVCHKGLESHSFLFIFHLIQGLPMGCLQQERQKRTPTHPGPQPNGKVTLQETGRSALEPPQGEKGCSPGFLGSVLLSKRWPPPGFCSELYKGQQCPGVVRHALLSPKELRVQAELRHFPAPIWISMDLKQE